MFYEGFFQQTEKACNCTQKTNDLYVKNNLLQKVKEII